MARRENRKAWEIAWGSDGTTLQTDRVDGGKPWEIAWGELRWEGARRKRHEATTRWTEGKPWEIAWGELRWEGARYGSDDRVDGREAVGNSLGRAPLGRSGMEPSMRWTDGKPWEIAWESSVGRK